MSKQQASIAEKLLSNDFEAYKSNISHMLKELGDIRFLIKIIQDNAVVVLWDSNHKKEALYLLATTDYLCRINNVPLVTNYQELRTCSFVEPIFSRDVLMEDLLLKSSNAKARAREKCIPEFLRHNIIEGDIRYAV